MVVAAPFSIKSPGYFPSATTNVKLALGGAAVRRRHGLEVEDEGHLKNLVVI